MAKKFSKVLNHGSSKKYGTSVLFQKLWYLVCVEQKVMVINHLYPETIFGLVLSGQSKIYTGMEPNALFYMGGHL